MLMMACRCGPRPQNFSGYIADAKRAARFDPTGTLDIRAAFRRQMDSRWSKLRRLALEAIDRNDMLGLAGVTHRSIMIASQTVTVEQIYPGSDKVKAFQSWIDAAMAQVILGDVYGSWTSTFINRTAERAIERAGELTGRNVGDAGGGNPYHKPGGSPGGTGGEFTSGEGGGGTVTVYHGTTAERVKSILETGLEIDARHNYDPSLYADERGRAVFVSTNRDDAIEYAQKQDIDSAALIEVHVPASEWAQFKSDIIDRNYTSSHYTTKNIPPEWIASARVYTRDPSSDFNRPNAPSWKDVPILTLEQLARVRANKKRFGDSLVEADHETVWIVVDVGGNKKTGDSLDQYRVQALASLTVVELQGVMEAVSQQAVRAFAQGMLSKQRPSQVARAVSAVINAIGKVRGRMVVETMVIKTFTAVTADAFRAVGITHVGTTPERIKAKAPIGDAARKIKQPRGKGGKFRKFTPKPSAREIAAILKREAALQEIELVEVLTAGDDDVCPICEDISEDGPYEIDEAEELIPAHPNCFLPGTLVEGKIIAGLKSFYAGPAIEIRTAKGNRISVTINHPVLTSLGPLMAKDLRKGMKLVSKGRNIGMATPSSIDEDKNNRPVPIEDVFNTLGARGLRSIKPSGHDLHGDARFINGQISIVFSDRRLMCDFDIAAAQAIDQVNFVSADRSQFCMTGSGSGRVFGGRHIPSETSNVGGSALLMSLASAHSGPLEIFCVGSTANFDIVKPEMLTKDVSFYSILIRQLFERRAGDISLDEVRSFSGLEDTLRTTGVSELNVNGMKAAVDRFATYAGFLDDLIDRSSGLIEFDEVREIRNFNFVGHVYDLQTTTGWIIANDTGCFNCRCALIPSDDERFADVRGDSAADAGFDPNQPRDDEGQWTTVGAGTPDEHIVTHAGEKLKPSRQPPENKPFFSDYHKQYYMWGYRWVKTKQAWSGSAGLHNFKPKEK